MPAIAADLPPEVIVTASRAEEKPNASPASVTLIGPGRIKRLGEPLVTSLLRQVPSMAVSTSGSAGSITEVRIRGAEADQTLLFVDGIRANDPAAANVPRFELLNGDAFSRIEVVRGPQSALWGSEAIGGVVAVEGGRAAGQQAAFEGGSFGFRRLSGAASRRTDGLSFDLSGGFQRTRGINAMAGSGDRDGYRNASARGRFSWQPDDGFELGASGFLLTGLSEFDGYDPLTFQRADTLDNSRNRLAAARLWGKAERGGAVISLWGSALGSSNRNFLHLDLVNRTSGSRLTGGAQAEHLLILGSTEHRLIAAMEGNRETFRSRNPGSPLADQQQDREQAALVGEWQAQWHPRFSTDLALRHDMFNRFKDRTTLRASALAELGGGMQLAASYGEGISQPSFVDLFGYPGFTVGNPNLKPERSRGWEASARLNRGRFRGALTYYRQRLVDEIVFTRDFRSTENAGGTSRREGFELEAGWHPSERLNLTAAYAFLDAEEQQRKADEPTREWRRPRHSGSVAADGQAGRLNYGASLAYVGKHRDRRDSFPYELVDLDSYWLAAARLGWQLTERLELFGRIANALDNRYEDLVGYRTEGRSAYAGVRLALGR